MKSNVAKRQMSTKVLLILLFLQDFIYCCLNKFISFMLFSLNFGKNVYLEPNTHTHSQVLVFAPSNANTL